MQISNANTMPIRSRQSSVAKASIEGRQWQTAQHKQCAIYVSEQWETDTGKGNSATLHSHWSSILVVSCALWALLVGIPLPRPRESISSNEGCCACRRTQAHCCRQAVAWLCPLCLPCSVAEHESCWLCSIALIPRPERLHSSAGNGALLPKSLHELHLSRGTARRRCPLRPFSTLLKDKKKRVESYAVPIAKRPKKYVGPHNRKERELCCHQVPREMSTLKTNFVVDRAQNTAA